MRKTVEGIIEQISPLGSLLGAENVKDLQKQIADLIVERVREDINGYDEYLFYPPDHNQCIRDAFDSVEKKITKMYKDTFLEVAQKAVDEIKSDFPKANVKSNE